MNDNGEVDKLEVDCSSLVSLIKCIRRDANLNTRLYWDCLQRQLTFSGFLIVGLGLVLKISTFNLTSCLVGVSIGIIGITVSCLLKRVAAANWLHVDKYNESCKKLEEQLPIKIREYAVMHTFEKKIEPGLEKEKIKPKNSMRYLSIILIGFWVMVLISSLLCSMAFSPNVKSLIEIMTKPLT